MNIIVTDISKPLNFYKPISGYIKPYSPSFTADWYTRRDTELIEYYSPIQKKSFTANIPSDNITFEHIKTALITLKIDDLIFAKQPNSDYLLFRVPKGFKFSFSVEIRKMLGLSYSKPFFTGGEVKPQRVIDFTPINFANVKNLRHKSLQIKTENNYLNDQPSDILAIFQVQSQIKPGVQLSWKFPPQQFLLNHDPRLNKLEFSLEDDLGNAIHYSDLQLILQINDG